VNEPATLLLAEAATARQVALRLGNDSPASCADPYEAILQIGRRPWKCIVLSAPQAQFEGLCRAARRLGRNARLVALCPPHAEPDVLPLSGGLIDDYLICPPTVAEWRRAVGLSAPTAPRQIAQPLAQMHDEPRPEPPAAAPAPVSETPAAPAVAAQHNACEEPAPESPEHEALSPNDYAQLVLATSSLPALEARIVELVRERLGIAAQWHNLDSVPPRAAALMMLGQSVRRALVSDRPAQDPRGQAMLEALGQCLPALAAAARRNESLHRLAITDELTGAYNRRYFFHLTDQILARAKGGDHRVTMLLYDIDNFKRYNDLFGHAVGDEILRETAALIKRIVRTPDIVARIGGDEFAVLFWDAQGPRSPDSHPPESALVLAERFRGAVAGHQFPSLGPEAVGSLTISGGLALFGRDGNTAEELLAKADEALIAVKKSGKNAIRLIGTS